MSVNGHQTIALLADPLVILGGATSSKIIYEFKTIRQFRLFFDWFLNDSGATAGLAGVQYYGTRNSDGTILWSQNTDVIDVFTIPILNQPATLQEFVNHYNFPLHITPMFWGLELTNLDPGNPVTLSQLIADVS